jgi:hypothetical protein
MSNFIKMFSGRKRDSDVWKYFEYKADVDKSACQVVQGDEIRKVKCRKEVAGKNTTNLKAHLRVYHAEVYSEFEKNETELKTGNTRRMPESSQSQTG